MIDEIVDTGMSYVRQGIGFIRDGINSLIGFTGLDPGFWTMILIILASLFLGFFVSKRFVTKPFGGTYFIWTLIISILFFIILMYI